MSDVEINLGTGKSKIEGSTVSIGDIAGNNIEKRLSDHIWREIQEVKERLRAIEIFLAGTPLGEPGLTAQVRDIKSDIRKIEREIEIVDVLDSRLDRLESILQRNDYSKISVSVYVFYGILFLLFLFIAGMYLIIWAGRV